MSTARTQTRTPQKLPGRFNDLVQLVPPRAIHDESTYENTMKMIDRILKLPKMTKGQEQYLDTLSTLVEAYEAEYHAIDTSDITPIEILQSFMDEHGMTASDLGRLLGDRAVGSKILRGERQLSKTHVKILAERFKVSPKLFL